MTYTEKRLEWFEEILRDGLSEDWYDRTPLEKQRAIDALFSTSIAQAIAEERDLIKREVFDIIDSNENKEMQNLRIKKIFIR